MRNTIQDPTPPTSTPEGVTTSEAVQASDPTSFGDPTLAEANAAPMRNPHHDQPNAPMMIPNGEKLPESKTSTNADLVLTDLRSVFVGDARRDVLDDIAAPEGVTKGPYVDTLREAMYLRGEIKRHAFDPSHPAPGDQERMAKAYRETLTKLYRLRCDLQRQEQLPAPAIR